jgi:SAM-dependent methyltransferase
MKDEEVKKEVRKGYAKIAKQESSCCGPSAPTCCTPSQAEDVSKMVGYTKKDLESLPDGANMGLGCGNPTAIASIEEGETVLDLGSGGGVDCFLAAEKVGKGGKVIGVDMTPEMIDKARENAKMGKYENVEFRLGEIEHLPVADNSVNLIISNCVINLAPDKKKVFEEAFRVLKPGGRIMVSDIVLKKELPEFIRDSIQAYVGCITGAIMKEDYLDTIKKAGFQDIELVDEKTYPAEFMSNDPQAKAVLKDMDISLEKIQEVVSSISSVNVKAVKPN